jgi:trehalose-phosphatase
VKIPHIYYAGNHGFELKYPDGTVSIPEDVKNFSPLLDQIQTSLQLFTHFLSGVIVERKKFSLAVHYRLLKDENMILKNSVNN